MIAILKEWLKRRWPRLSLRTYLFASFFLVAALPGVGAVGLRVYENTLVRQTEAELVAQGAALAASAAALWPDAPPGRGVIHRPDQASGPYGMAAITAVAVAQTEFGATRSTARDQFTGAAIGGLIGLAAYLSLGPSVPTYALGVVLAILIYAVRTCLIARRIDRPSVTEVPPEMVAAE